MFDKVIQVLSDAVIHEDTFVFLGSEAWARNAKVVEGDRGEKVRGSLTLEPMGFDVDYGFKVNLLLNSKYYRSSYKPGELKVR